MFVETVFASDLAVALFTGEVLFFRVHAQHVNIQWVLILKLVVTCRTGVASKACWGIFYFLYFRFVTTSNLMFFIFFSLRGGLEWPFMYLDWQGSQLFIGVSWTLIICFVMLEMVKAALQIVQGLLISLCISSVCFLTLSTLFSTNFTFVWGFASC